jgi:peptidoglycan/xylan/chitin deacetylase (PgdA/CDA1 family)
MSYRRRSITGFVRRNIKKGVIFLFFLLGRSFRLKGIPVLLYHSIDNSGSPHSISRGLFRKQLKYLKENGYQTISLNTLCNYLVDDLQLPQKAVVITFDDGFKNNYDIVLPMIKEFGFTATLFLVTGYVSKCIAWEKTVEIPDQRLASWEEIHEMSDTAIEINAHSVTHPKLCRLTADQAKNEIQGSRVDIEARLGKQVNFFAYPYGEFNDHIKSIVKELGFQGAVTCISGVTKLGDDCYALKRMSVNGVWKVGEKTQMNFFKCCLLGTANWYIEVKNRFNLSNNRRFESNDRAF